MQTVDDISQVAQLVEGVDGFLTDVEGRTLYQLARESTGPIVEIGSWKGKSTIWLSKGSMAGGKSRVYAVDPHTGSSEHRVGGKQIWTFDEFRANIARAGVDSMVEPLVMTSADAAAKFEQPVSLCFIDGAHEYEFVKQDFEAWFPKVMPGGTIAFHDVIGNSDPTRYVRELLTGPLALAPIGLFGSIYVVRKVDACSPAVEKLRRRESWVLGVRALAVRCHVPPCLRQVGKRLLRRSV